LEAADSSFTYGKKKASAPWRPLDKAGPYHQALRWMRGRICKHKREVSNIKRTANSGVSENIFKKKGNIKNLNLSRNFVRNYSYYNHEILVAFVLRIYVVF
jgi:hypothetical protein